MIHVSSEKDVFDVIEMKCKASEENKCRLIY